MAQDPIVNIRRRGLLTGVGAAAVGAGLATAGVLTFERQPDPGGPRQLSSLERGQADGPIAYRGTIIHFKGDPEYDLVPKPGTLELIEDGFLAVAPDGKVHDVGAWSADHESEYGGRTVDYRGKVIMPGFIDTHVHYVQMDVIAGYGDQILQWLNKYIFPAESKFQDINHARDIASFFLDTLLSCGTTTALVWSSTPRESVDGFFEEAQRRNLRMITGAVVQDESMWKGNQNDPGNTPQEKAAAAKQKTIDLIEKWHGKGRLLYAVTPRFAPSCSWPMLTMCRDVLDEYQRKNIPVWFQTHLSENLEEESIIRKKYEGVEGAGEMRTYAEAYHKAGLFRPRSLYAHCVEINQGDREAMQKGQASIGHSPTSNFFLGSGYANMHAAKQAGVRFGYGTDCGGGTHYSILFTCGAAYKAQALRARQYIPSRYLPPMRPQQEDDPLPVEPLDGPAKQQPPFTNDYPKLTAWQALYRATRGGANALWLDTSEEMTVPGQSQKVRRGGIGWFDKGNEADFQVLTLAPTPIVDRRIKAVQQHPMKKPDADGEPPQLDTSTTRDPIDMWHEGMFAMMILSDERATFATYIMGKLAYHQQHGMISPAERARN